MRVTITTDGGFTGRGIGSRSADVDVDDVRPEELAAFARPQVLLTLAVVVFGLGGLFASYSYVAPMLTDVAGLADSERVAARTKSHNE